VAATQVVPGLLARPPGGQAGALAGAPRFFAGVTPGPRGLLGSTQLHIYRSATGRVISSVPLPGGEHAFAAVARLGGDGAYVAAAVTSSRACTTQLYRFTIDAQGRPGRLTPLSVPQVAGSVGELAGSADGNVLAYNVTRLCQPRAQGQAGVIRLATRHVTTWTPGGSRLQPNMAGSLSLTADGSVLGFVTGPFSADLWVLPTSAPAGPITSRARKVPHLHGLFRAVLASTGSRVYAETGSARGGVVLGVYSTATGKRIRSLGRIGPGGTELMALPLALDSDGTHLLITGYPHLGPAPGSSAAPASSSLSLPPGSPVEDHRRVEEMNLASGHLITVTTAQAPVTDNPYTTATW
jgi:hypothetical protein